MQIYTKAFLSFSLLVGVSALSQETHKDSLKNNKLEEVVVTGQFEPQSIKRSVSNVRVITKQDIKNLAANNLSDVLNQYLNITVQNSGSDGRSKVSMFGLDSQYFKILVDNIPLVSDTGLGNNIDLTQVNLDDIERIEIIEGSMGVTHGANAVSGILNIITKKFTNTKWEIAANVQEETVGKEFAFFDKGRHIQSFKVSHSISENWFVSVGANRNDFAGFFDDKKGKDYIENDDKRGYRWLPKQQFVTNAMLGYTKDRFSIFYKFDYFNENVDYYNPIVVPVPNYPFESTYFSSDRRYVTNRFYHHLNSNGHLFTKLLYNVSLSFQKQQRDIERFNYYILSDEERNFEKNNFQSKEVIYSTGTVSNFFTNKMFDVQLGYELVNEKGFASAASGTFRDEDLQLVDISKRLENYDIFTSAEINLNDKLSIRPGFRYSMQSQFDDQYATSLGFRYLLKKNIELRASLGKSYRTPNFDELYTYFVDSNHNLQGNSALTPEESFSYEVSAKKTSHFDSGVSLSNNVSASYQEVNDRISLIMTQIVPTMEYKYMNIDKYKMWNISTTHQLAYKNFSLKLGASLVGISQKIDLASLDAVSDDAFLYSLQLNSSATYNIPKWNTMFSIYYKYNGKYQQYVQSTVNTVASFELSEVDSYGWMDASVRKTFFKNKFEVTAGARNILNITDVQSSISGGGNSAHAAASSALQLGYGRSYFLKLTYNLNFN